MAPPAMRAAGAGGAGEDILRLARLLVERVLDESDRGDPRHEDEVIVDVELEGVRCLVVAHPEATASPPVALSPREQEIARMVAEGYPNKTIAAVLDISSWTVSTHLRRIFAKLGVRTRAAMVARVLDQGLMHEADADRASAKSRDRLTPSRAPSRPRA
jgi:DNA-binding CsgD family transcriptional regulator